MVNVISKERNLGLKMFMGSMTSYPLERSVTKTNTEKKTHTKKNQQHWMHTITDLQDLQDI